MTTTGQPLTIPLWPNGLPGGDDPSRLPEIEERAAPPISARVIRNVSQPTLTAFLPDKGNSNGTGIIICPGGGFHVLAIDHEGVDVARWFQARGVAAFILKYRLIETTPRQEDFDRYFWTQVVDPNDLKASGDRMTTLAHDVAPLAIEDGKQAVRLVRGRAAEWGLGADKIGIMGFSAGGRVTVGVLTDYTADSRPDFGAPIYGALWTSVTAPADAPPLFTAYANDDVWAVEPGLALHGAWQAVGRPVELHAYARGGHGFGMQKQGLPIDGWIDRLGEWLTSQGFLP